MKNYARQQFGCKEAEAVSAAVASVEKVTSGEVVPVVRSYSSRYRRPVLRWILGCQTVFVCSWALGTATLGRPLTPFGLLVFAGLYLLLTAFLFLLPEICPPFLRLLAGRRLTDEKVTEQAVNAFVRYGVSKTEQRNGILIYVSLFERQVVILADKGIDEKTAPETWKAVSEQIAAGMRDGRPGEAMVRAVESCRGLLAEHFPPVNNKNHDELPNFIME